MATPNTDNAKNNLAGCPACHTTGKGTPLIQSLQRLANLHHAIFNGLPLGIAVHEKQVARIQFNTLGDALE